jgi:hypothetical protein
VALIDTCHLVGAIAEKDNTVYAEFEIENPSSADARVEFHYSVQFTPGMSAMARMLPMPRELTNGCCTATVPAGGRRIERVVARQKPNTITVPSDGLLTPSKGESPNEVSKIMEKTSAEHWTLLVSRSKITKAEGWGGVLPSAAFPTNRLEKGSLILATSSSKQPEKPLSPPK